MKSALNLVLILPDDRKFPGLVISCGIIDLQNDSNMLVKNLVRFGISVPMSYPSALRAFPPPRSRLRLL